MRIDVLGVGFDNVTMTEAVARGASLLIFGWTNAAACGILLSGMSM